MHWTDQDRLIFQYPSIDGTMQLFADPLAVRRKLLARTGGKIDEFVDRQRLMFSTSQEINNGSTQEADPGIFIEGSAAEEMIVAAVVHAFDLPPFDPTTGGGATQEYCLLLFDSFNEWREQKKTSGETTQGSSHATDFLPDHLRSHTVRLSDLSGMSVD